MVPKIIIADDINKHTSNAGIPGTSPGIKRNLKYNQRDWNENRQSRAARLI